MEVSGHRIMGLLLKIERSYTYTRQTVPFDCGRNGRLDEDAKSMSVDASISLSLELGV